MPKPPAPFIVLMLTAPLLLVTGCAAPSPHTRPVVAPSPAIHKLPRTARPPDRPPLCSPTCSANAAADILSWRDLLTQPTQPAASAPTGTTP